MISSIHNQYIPDYVSPPGETLLELIEERGISQAELAERMGRPKKTINEIVKSKAAITPQTALQLERALGVDASFWNNRERNYRQYLAQLEEAQQLGSRVDWLRGFSISTMVKLGWIQACDDEVEQLRELLNFFGVVSPDQWETLWSRSSTALRKTPAFHSNWKDVSAWLRRGEIEAQRIYCQPYNPVMFRRVLIEEIRSLTLESPEVFQPELVRQCAEAGVAVVFVAQLPKAKVSGATRWLTSEKALIQLSLRYKTDDHLWFTFFHEAGHILLHGKRDIFLENDDCIDVKEQQANDFAAKILIPPARLRSFLQQSKPRYPRQQAIRAFAAEIGVAPGIVVGRLQHDGVVPFSHYNGLKRSLVWAA